ncbi:hypothetical protein [Vibrio sp. Hep-1b-8]|uniref:hypothetical protein n=1 Tax=Vibrio sp. Hep-1b-8 TaxID=2144187 RepID=UPI001110DF98|nr:hypothetical protein [Vibrio sp. Hep-1b-8]TMX34090.1 hypothetical protein DA100_16305 [Vibrio sp. Hep-1b-8]
MNSKNRKNLIETQEWVNSLVESDLSREQVLESIMEEIYTNIEILNLKMQDLKSMMSDRKSYQKEHIK